MEKTLKNISEIMKNDLKSAFQNPIVVIVLVALIIIPSLYALINIEACWDPYQRTDDIDFAIANLDNGSQYDGEKIEAGSELVNELKNNSDFNWKFVSEKDLRQGVDNGTYYAGIIIPKNFSQKVVSITSDNPESAKLIYIVNIKENPVANKLTDSGAKAVYNNMNAKIVEFINIAAYGKLGDLQSSLSSGSMQLSSGASQLSSGAHDVSNGANKVSSGASNLANAKNQVNSGANDVQNGASQIKSGSNNINKGASDLSNAAGQVSSGSKKVQDSASQIQSSIDPSKLPDGPVKNVVEGSVKLANSSSKIASGSNSVAQGSVKLANNSAKLANGASDVAGGASKLANGAVDLADGSGKLAEGSLSLAAGSQLLANSAASALFSASSSLAIASDSLSDVTGIDKDKVGDYFYSPVELEKEELYPVDNYGSQVAPFYIVLSMWIGAVITGAMIKVGSSHETKYKPIEVYFGKLALFIIMSILQALITLSSAFILGITVENPALFIFSGVLISVIFMTIVYSFLSALGTVGEGVAVILLVLQISGTGGIYPIEIMSPIFQQLYSYLPMTHAITLLRESALGIVWSNYIPALVFLVVVGILTEIIAILIKTKADKRSHYFEERLKESGLFK